VISETDASTDAYQLSIGSVEIDPVSGAYQYGAFYTDLINQIAANGGLTSNPNRLFETGFYSWSPPIDYDKHINFSSYFWTGPGDALENGEYITREVSGSQTYVHLWNGTTLTAMPVGLVNGLPAPDAPGVLVEDTSTPARIIYVSNGLLWSPIQYVVNDGVPTDFTGIGPGTYFYITRTGPMFQRPVIQTYSAAATRWIAQPVVVDAEEPEYPTTGMIWEDSRTPGERVFKRFTGSNWIVLTYTSSGFISGIGVDGQFIYDLTSPSQPNVTDGWTQQNWWRHFEDLSQADRSELLSSDQAVRPILEFWNGIQLFPGTTKTGRNQQPQFNAYHIDPNSFTLVGSGIPTTIMQFKRGSGVLDTVLNMPLSFDQFGSMQFDMTLDEDTTFVGYKYFFDRRTGLFHSTWHHALTQTQQEFIQQTPAQTTFYEVPPALTSNPDHDVPSTVSRSLYLTHMSGVISSQTNFFGNTLGINSYRWTSRDPVVGSTIIDPEHSLLRLMATLQTPHLDVPNTIRSMSREYTRIIYRFTNRLNQLWDQLSLNDGSGRLLMSVTNAADAVLTLMFQTQIDSSVYSMSGMGTYMETRALGGVATVVGIAPRPIYIPSSPARFGLILPYQPGTFITHEGQLRLRGHDGSSIVSFGDQRDLVWLELQNRFFNAIPAQRRTETSTVSSRYVMSRFYTQDFYGGYLPNLTVPNSVLQIVDDYHSLVSPAAGIYLSRLGPSYAYWDGVSWGLVPVQIDDIFLNHADGLYYTYNNIGIVPVPIFNAGSPDYATNEYRLIIRREFERWANDNKLDYTLNPDFNENDPFTWNYSNVGVEGNYHGLYLRLYRTVRPDSRPWEIAGYSLQPSWWLTQYPPTLIAPDGTPRYNNLHPMWTDLRNGLVNAPLGVTKPTSPCSHRFRSMLMVRC
jgi:hypothetical protein